MIEALERMPKDMEVFATIGSRMPDRAVLVEWEADLGVVVIHTEK